MTEIAALIDHGARAHSSVVGGSSAERVLRCPGSVNIAALYPNTTSEFAAEGTACHEAMDLILGGETIKHDRDVIGLVLNGIEITEELFEDAILPALEQFDRLQDELGGIDFFNEQRVQFPGIENAFGTTDIVGAAKDRSVVLDWKFGRGVAVTAEQNEQMMFYAWAAMHTAPASDFFEDDKPIELFIIQPRVNDGEPFTRWMTTARQLEAFARELVRAVEVSGEPDPPLNLGSWCKFCAGKPGCPAYNNLAKRTLALSREELAAKLAEVGPYADAFIALGNEIKAMIHAELEKGGTVAGWKLVNKRANRSWADEEKALKHLAKMGLPAAERHVKKIVSPAQAEAALKRNHLPAELPAVLVKKESSGTTLAPESDSRPAVASGASALKMLAASLAGKV